MNRLSLNRKVFLLLIAILLCLPPTVRAQEEAPFDTPPPAGGQRRVVGLRHIEIEIASQHIAITGDISTIQNFQQLLSGTIQGKEIPGGDNRYYEYRLNILSIENDKNIIYGQLSIYSSMGSNTNEPAPEALLAKARERLRVTFEKISQLEHQSFNDQREHWDSIREKYRIKVDDLQKSLPDIDDTLPGANGEQVAEKMIAAHVELAGLEARRDAILEQIQKRKQEGTKIENNYNKSAEEYTRLNENLQKETNGDKQAAIQKELDRVQSEFSRLQQEMTTKASQYGPEQTAELNKMLVQTEIDLAGTKARLEMLQKMNNILHQEHKALRKHEEIFRELENARTKLKEASDRLERMNLDAAHKPLEIIVLDDAPAAKPPEKKDGKISPSPSPFSPIPTMPAAKPPEKKDEKK